jgi:hypothetical protein
VIPIGLTWILIGLAVNLSYFFFRVMPVIPFLIALAGEISEMQMISILVTKWEINLAGY